jgi:RNA recognition motif. (a.k.a. RRM, RBD, or RNP domain)
MNKYVYKKFQPRCFTVVDHVSKSLLQSSNSVSLFQSNYALGFQQDTDFATPYSARARMYDLPPSNTFGAHHHQMSSSSTSSLSGIGLGGPSTSAGFNHHHHNQHHHQNQLPPSSNALTNLIVNYLPQDCNERELHSMFSPMGPVETCRVVRDFKVSSFLFLSFACHTLPLRTDRVINQ